MKMKITALVGASMLTCFASATPAVAQDEGKQVFLYTTYFHCKAGFGEQADEAMTKWAKPGYDAAAADGTIKSWGYLGHHTGGDWMRVVYHAADSLKGALAASDKLDEKLSPKASKESAKWDKAFSDACGSHEDYVWHRIAGNDGTGKRGSVGFSVYYVCDSSREDQADQLVKRVMASNYDKLVADGKLVSWAWWEHIVGGKYRRLETYTAANLDALMDARAALNKSGQDDPLGDDLNGICGSHQDYIWNIKMQGP